jgi:hypothetical protein
MASDVSFPYTPTPGKLEEFLKKLQSVGVPGKIDNQYLGSLGFGSSNSRPFIPILKKIGMLDMSGAPTEIYTKGLRGDEKGRTLVAAGIRAGYDNVFQTFGDAQSRPDSELTTFFRSHSDLDDKKVGLAVKTFKSLCKLGDFTAMGKATDGDDDDSEEEREEDKVRRPSGRSGDGGGSSNSVTINVNISLSVDATSDPAVYDAFFAAMAKHIKVLDAGASNSA